MNTQSPIARLIAASLLLCCTQAAFAGTPPGRLYVNQSVTAGGANDGLSWANAFSDLQLAINAAGSGTEIWVAAGTYKPTTTAGRTASFVLKPSLKLYGGFAGTEIALGDRNIVANRTILSGDIDAAGNTDSYHVLYAVGVSYARVSGFTITQGRADGNGTDGLGGGLYCEGGTGTSIEDCDFVQNYAQGGGGGVYCKDSPITLLSCLFAFNSANPASAGLGLGGAACIVAADSPHVSSQTNVLNCMFRNNSAYNGGAVFNDGNATGIAPAFVNCTICSNSATTNGGGMFNSQAATPILTNCIIYSNTAGSGGTGAQIKNWTPGVDVPAVSHCDIQDSGGSGGWDTALGTDNGGNIAADPQFVNALTKNFRLRGNSPCVDAGATGAIVPSTDKDGNPRPYAATLPDMGPYESSGPGSYRFYVKDNGAGDGSSWLQAAGNLSATVRGAGAGDEIWVTSNANGGFYTPGATAADTFQMQTSLTLRGSFSGTETQLSDRTWSTRLPPSTLSGSAVNNHVITGASGITLDGFTIRDGNANGGGDADYGAGLFCGVPSDGGGPITILNCAFLSNAATVKGGALFTNGYTRTSLTNCVFWNNRALSAGGAVCTSNGNLAVLNCTISGGASLASGIAVGAGGTLVTVANSIIWDTPPDAALVVSTGRTTTMTNTDCVAWRAGVGNFSQDPMFRDTAAGDVRLKDGSPCLNALPLGTLGVPAKDIMNVSRPQGSVLEMGYDLGAYERPYAAMTLGNLTQTYDGTAKTITATAKKPDGTDLNVSVVYAGDHTSVGACVVIATINDADYSGSLVGALDIKKGAATVSLKSSDLTTTYNGSVKSVGTTTTPTANMQTVIVTYNGSTTPPTLAGSYLVNATLTSNANYADAFASGTLTINKASAAVTLTNSDLTRTYDGTAKAVGFSVLPTALSSSVMVTYNGSASAPSDVGNYTVVAALSDQNYAASAAIGTLVISPIPVAVSLSNLSQMYDGTPKPATAKATRTDTGLDLPASDITITYNGSVEVPSKAGVYTVVASVANTNYAGANAQGLLVIDTAPTVAPSASPSTGTVPLAVTFSANAKDSDTDTLTYSWDFGDGSAASTEQAPVHTFAGAGPYDVTVTVSDGKGGTATGKTTITATLPEEKVPGGTDTDGDGFSNEIETALGSNPNSAASTPDKLATPAQKMTLSAPKMSIKLNFVKSESDSIAVSSVLLVNDGYKPAGQTVIVDVGGVVKSFSLAGNGSVKNGGDAFAMRIKLGKDHTAPLQVAKFSVKMTKGDFATQLAAYKLTASVSGPRDVPVTVIFDGQVYQKTVTLAYKASSKSGSAK